MIIEEVRALVLRCVDVGENDKLLTLFSEEKGRIMASVRGSRSLKSRYFSAAQSFCYSRFILCKKNDRYYVREAELCENFFEIREDIEKTALAGYVAEALLYVTMEESDPALFRLSLNILYAIAKNRAPLPQIKAVFEVRAAGILGFMPDLHGCCYCGRRDGDFFFDIMNGQIECKECREKNSGAAPSVYEEDYRAAHIVCLLNSGACTAFRYVLSCPPDRLLSFRLDGEEARLFGIAAETYFLNQIEHGFASLDFYKELIRTNK